MRTSLSQNRLLTGSAGPVNHMRAYLLVERDIRRKLRTRGRLHAGILHHGGDGYKPVANSVQRESRHGVLSTVAATCKRVTDPPENLAGCYSNRGPSFWVPPPGVWT